MEIKVSRLNFSSVTRKVKELIPNALPLVTRQDILAKRLQPVAELMKSKAHKDTGESAEAIAVEVLDASDSTTALAAVGVGKDGYPLFFQEYGTRNRAPRPTIRPAWESEEQRVRDGIAADVAAAVRRSS